MTTHIVLNILLALIGILLVFRCRALEYDPNYGILATAAGMWRVKANRRRRGVIMLDFDNFKAFNDRYGHTEADRRVRKALRFRWNDPVRVIRRGGDEIVIECPADRCEEFGRYAQERLHKVGLTATMVAYDSIQDFTRAQANSEHLFLEMKRQNRKNALLVHGRTGSRLVEFPALAA